MPVIRKLSKKRLSKEFIDNEAVTPSIVNLDTKISTVDAQLSQHETDATIHHNLDVTPVNGATTHSISSDWAYGHANDTSLHSPPTSVILGITPNTVQTISSTSYVEVTSLTHTFNVPQTAIYLIYYMITFDYTAVGPDDWVDSILHLNGNSVLSHITSNPINNTNLSFTHPHFFIGSLTSGNQTISLSCKSKLGASLYINSTVDNTATNETAQSSSAYIVKLS